MNLSTEQLFEIVRYSIVRLDGAWFLALAGKLGKEKAWKMDVFVRHTKNLNQGDDYCEVVISRQTHQSPKGRQGHRSEKFST
jgi:hypothetical protein